MIQHEQELRDFQYEQQVRCREAVMMGLHERLGQNSDLLDLEPEMLMDCIDKAFPLKNKQLVDGRQKLTSSPGEGGDES